MKQLITNTAIAVLIILLVLPGLIPVSDIQRISCVCTLCLLLVGLSAYYTFVRRSAGRTAGSVPAKPPVPVTETEADRLPPLNTEQGLAGLVETLRVAYKEMPEATLVDSCLTELKVYQQCYLWVEHMHEKYGLEWDRKSRNAEMPFAKERYPELRSLVMEIALHTIDFCRYRTNYINCTDRMKVNPAMLLLDETVEKAGGLPLSDNPYEIPKEVRLLHQLIQNDGIELKDVTIHGYYDTDKQ